VYHLTVDTPTGSRDCVLKASPDDGSGGDHGVALEARILAVLDEHTSIPVPEVYGAVDADPEVPAPAFLMASMPGRTVPRSAYGDLAPATLESLARSTGRHLAELHALDAVDAFGYLRPAGPDLRGERPPGGPDRVAVADPDPEWPRRLSSWAETALDDLDDTRFGDLAPAVRSALDRRIDSLSGPFRPALAHVDANVENLAFDPDTGEATAMLDWAFTLAAPPAYDLAFVENGLAGGHWRFVPSTPDRRELVRTALLDGYRKGGSAAAVEASRRHRDAYRLLVLTMGMVHFEDFFVGRDLPDGTVGDAARGCRTEVATLLER
jgi:aminoglycoside phosphotransferase (APT) family kinase protein